MWSLIATKRHMVNSKCVWSRLSNKLINEHFLTNPNDKQPAPKVAYAKTVVLLCLSPMYIRDAKLNLKGKTF